MISRRKFMATLSALPGLGFLRPDPFEQPIEYWDEETWAAFISMARPYETEIEIDGRSVWVKYYSCWPK